jgi:hypothetical protein
MIAWFDWYTAIQEQKNRTTISRTTQVISAIKKCEKSGFVAEEQ